MLGAAIVPAPIWAAALVPFPAEQNMTASIEISSFDVLNVSALWEPDNSIPSFGDNEWRQWTIKQGTFAYNTQIFRGGLLSSAQEASLTINGQQKHAKLDRSSFSYIGRSFGAGSAAGFIEFTDIGSPQWYQFNETGLRASVHCFYNTSTQSYFTLISQDGNRMKLYESNGTVANGTLGRLTTYASWLPIDLFAWNHGYDSSKHVSQIQMFTGANTSWDPYDFKPFQGVQCDISFRMRTATVMVNASSELISVRSDDAVELPWPAYGDAVANMVDEDLGWITATDNCQNTGCTLGQSLVFNLNTLKERIQGNSTETLLRGTEEFVASLVDNIMINRLLTRYASGAPQSTQRVTATVGAPSLVFGDRKFIIIVCVLNTAIVLAYLVECARTRGWNTTPSFDIMNDSEVIIAAFEGGRSFEKNKHVAPPILDTRLRDDSLLKLHFNDSRSQKPVLLPHATGMEYMLLPLDVVSTNYTEGSTPSFGYLDFEERHLL